MQVKYKPNVDGRMAGQVSVVLGGTKGIGEAIARRFAQEGAKVVITGRSMDEANLIVQEIKEAGGDAAACFADLADYETIRQSLEFASGKYGKITSLVNNANPGDMGGETSVEEETLEHWEKQLDRGLTGACFIPVKYGLPHLLAAGGGTIVQISSIVSYRAGPTTAYPSGKAAQNIFIQNVAYQFAKRGIRANTIASGMIKTPSSAPATFDDSPFAPHFQKTIPLGLGEPVDIANVALLLSSDEGRYVTGQTITVDGGWTSFLPGITAEINSSMDATK